MESTAGVYVHIPFCAKKCGYCDFNAYAGYRDESKARYVRGLCAEMGARGDRGVTVPTVFFGGGTPSLLPASDIATLLGTLRAHFALTPDAEISLEANPDDITPAYLHQLRQAGVNRLSLGVQTFNNTILQTIDRIHDAAQAQNAVRMAQDAGFTNLSVDLMFGLPYQTLADWERSLDTVFSLGVTHLSLYGLMVEERTIFWARRKKNALPLPPEEAEAAMFQTALERTQAAGYERYEISNYARSGYACRHNQLYWRNDEYYGFGAGAASYVGGVRSSNERYPNRYAETVQRTGSATVTSECLTSAQAQGETIMLGLRMAEGVDLTAFEARFGVALTDQHAAAIALWQERGYLTLTPTHLRLTDAGLFYASDVMADFLLS